jgi:hypothetical protein
MARSAMIGTLFVLSAATIANARNCSSWMLLASIGGWRSELDA